jgi:Secretion system C-terminal sorting domain/FG-GAP-like repeat
MGSVNGAGYTLVDMNGDGFPDLVDAEDNSPSTVGVWQNGSQRYWKVYLNTGVAEFYYVPVEWLVPDVKFHAEDMGSVNGAGYTLVDINGDGFADLVDSEDNNANPSTVWQNGTQRFWKVYLSNGNSEFSSIPVSWNIPDVKSLPQDMASVNGTGYSLVDINGDGFPDLVDAEDNSSTSGAVWQNGSQRYWKVYLNNGTSISPTATDWNVPDVESNPEDMGSVTATGHSLVDINGDGFPDLVDSEDNFSGLGAVWQISSQRYWKVYLNNGTSISPTATDWNIPEVEFQPTDMGSVYGAGYTLVDMNGDGFPDIVDSKDNNSSAGSVWYNGLNTYWKIYLNYGNAISGTSIDWIVPQLESQYSDMGNVYGAGYSLADLNGDRLPDLIDARENNSSFGNVWSNNFNRFWKVYRNLSPVQIQELELRESILKVYPNPFAESFTLDFQENQKNITITVTDLVGKVIQTNTYRNVQSLHVVLDAPAGSYFLSVIEASGKRVTIPMIKN